MDLPEIIFLFTLKECVPEMYPKKIANEDPR
jgi:hypothetical protein